jgi:sterol 3beta-glucosyltransferase
MRVLVVAVGSTGDVAPYTGLGARLQDARHQVAIAAFEPFSNIVQNAGLEFRPLPGDPLATRLSECARHGRRGVYDVLHLARLLSSWMVELGEAMMVAARKGTDVLLLSGGLLGGVDIAEGLGIPCMGVFLTPGHPTGEFPPPVGLPTLGRMGNKLAGRALLRALSVALSSGVRRLRAELGLPPRSIAESVRLQEAASWPVFYGFSPSVVPRPSDWRSGLEIVGYYWPYVGDWTPPPELVDFLAAGAPPVFVGFGSMVPGDPIELGALVKKAIRRSGMRAVVQSGWAGLEIHGSDMLTIGDVPHAWLFPQMAAVVHHCGAGTTGAALRAGVPTVPVPISDDQPFWAWRQATLGVCPDVVPRKRLTVDRLAAALRAAVRTPSYRLRAEEIALRIRAEDGCSRVVEAVSRLAS